MRIVSATVSRPIEDCWRVFTDPATLPHWVPGLTAARLVRVMTSGLPAEIAFEYVAGLSYSLHYAYEVDRRVVHWEPVDEDGKRGGVRGYAMFVAIDDGTEISYALEHDEGRKAAERALDDPRLILEAFARYVDEHA